MRPLKRLGLVWDWINHTGPVDVLRPTGRTCQCDHKADDGRESGCFGIDKDNSQRDDGIRAQGLVKRLDEDVRIE